MKTRIRIVTAGIILITMALTLSQVNVMAEEQNPLSPEEGTAAVTAVANENKDRPTASCDVAFMSQYIWRGYEMSKGSVVIQPSVTVGYKGLGLNLWGNLDSNKYGDPNKDQSKWTETDMTASYGTGFGPVGVDLGYIYYALDSAKDTQELYIGVSGDVILAPTLTIYRDIDEYPGWYINLGISHSVELPHEITLDLAGSVAYYYSNTDNIVEYDNHLNPTSHRFRNFQNGLISLGLTIPLDKRFTVAPSISYSFPLGNEAKNMLKATSLGNSAYHLFGGVTLSVAF